MDTNKNKLTVLQSDIFRLLCIRSGDSLNQREISKLVKVSPTAVATAVLTLEKEGLIIREKQKTMNLALIKLNRDNKKVMQLKRVENLKQIYESSILEYLEDELPGSTIILFGSYSRGDDTLTSDIDIAIIGRKPKELNLKKFESLLERKIILNFYDSFSKIHKDLKENLCNGIILSGGISL